MELYLSSPGLSPTPSDPPTPIPITQPPPRPHVDPDSSEPLASLDMVPGLELDRLGTGAQKDEIMGGVKEKERERGRERGAEGDPGAALSEPERELESPTPSPAKEGVIGDEMKGIGGEVELQSSGNETEIGMDDSNLPDTLVEVESPTPSPVDHVVVMGGMEEREEVGEVEAEEGSMDEEGTRAQPEPEATPVQSTHETIHPEPTKHDSIQPPPESPSSNPKATSPIQPFDPSPSPTQSLSSQNQAEEPELPVLRNVEAPSVTFGRTEIPDSTAGESTEMLSPGKGRLGMGRVGLDASVLVGFGESQMGDEARSEGIGEVGSEGDGHGYGIEEAEALKASVAKGKDENEAKDVSPIGADDMEISPTEEQRAALEALLRKPKSTIQRRAMEPQDEGVDMITTTIEATKPFPHTRNTVTEPNAPLRSTEKEDVVMEDQPIPAPEQAPKATRKSSSSRARTRTPSLPSTVTTSYPSLKVPDLKKILQKRSLSIAGNKADIVARLQEDDHKKAAGEIEELAPVEKVDPKTSKRRSIPDSDDEEEEARSPAKRQEVAGKDVEISDVPPIVQEKRKEAVVEERKSSPQNPTPTSLQPSSSPLNPTKRPLPKSSHLPPSTLDPTLFHELKTIKLSALTARNAHLASQIALTREKLEAVKKELRGDPGETVKGHIRLLHEYNDVRDVGQGLLGLIVEQRGGGRVGELYGEFGVGLND